REPVRPRDELDPVEAEPPLGLEQIGRARDHPVDAPHLGPVRAHVDGGVLADQLLDAERRGVERLERDLEPEEPRDALGAAQIVHLEPLAREIPRLDPDVVPTAPHAPSRSDPPRSVKRYASLDPATSAPSSSAPSSFASSVSAA